MMYPLQAAQIRNAVLRQACGFAIDRAMRRLHDGPPLPTVDVWEPVLALAHLTRGEATYRFHQRMKTDPSSCRWCGLAAREALAEMEEAP